MLTFYTNSTHKPVRAVVFVAGFYSLMFLSGCQFSGAIPVPESSASQIPTETTRNRIDSSRVYNNRIEAQFVAANAALDAGHNDVAKALLLNLTSDAPELSSPWINLGIVYLNLGAEDNAIRAFERALSIRPDNCEALNRLGIVAREAGDFELAEARYLGCLEIMPEFSEAHLNLGILYELYMGKYASALSEYREYVAGLDEPDRRVGGWIKDLERRQSSMLATENY